MSDISLANNYLVSLEVENFLSHKKSIIHFAEPGKLTVIVGESGSGKSSGVSRPLKWLLYNMPNGTDFIRPGCTFSRVTGNYASGYKVIRERTASKNQYVIVSPDGTRKVFEGFGMNVPLEVQEITRVRPIIVGNGPTREKINVNISEQLDGAFLGKPMTGSRRAEVLGVLAGTEKYDVANKAAGTELYRKEQDEKRLGADVDRLVGDVAKYDYLPAMAFRIGELEQLTVRIKADQERRHQLGNMAQSLIAYVTLIQSYQLTLERLKNIDSADILVLSSQKNLEKLAQLRQSSKALAENKGFIEDNMATIERHIKLDAIQTLFEKITASNEKLTKLQSITADLGKVDDITDSAKVVIARWTGLPSAEEQLVSLVGNDSKRTLLQGLKTTLRSMNSMITICQDKMQRLTNLDAANILTSNIDNVVSKRNNLQSYQKKLSDVQSGIDEFRGTTIVWEQRVSELNGAYHDALSSLGVCRCPICGVEHNPLELQKAS